MSAILETRREPENATFAYLDAFVDELARNGLTNVVMCPGSRSTPLAYAFSRNERIKLWVQLDERSAAFFALGMAKAAGNPVALFCTSGTAAANFFPALVEAHYARVPLLVLTADRPPELREVGAPQAIDQNRLYGVYARWFLEMALPEASNEMLRYVRTVAGRALAMATGAPAGVVHLNFPLREPLVPVPIPGQPLPPPDSRDPIAWYGRPDGRPYLEGMQIQRAAQSEISDLLPALKPGTRGLIICGPNASFAPEFAAAVTELALKLRWPVLADPLSGLRGGTEPGYGNPLVDNYDAFLRVGVDKNNLIPEFVLRFGAMPTSKPLLLFLKSHPEAETWLIDGGDGWEDPTALVGRTVHADPIMFCKVATEKYGNFIPPQQWLKEWLVTADLTGAAIEEKFEQSSELAEAKVFSELSRLLPSDSTLYVGNSMPVRDLDTFFKSRKEPVRILGNRGANGIDGVVSSALGASTVSSNPTFLVLGDISFYHDMNGLLAAKMHKLDATIIVLNNDGGGIFSFLPQANFPSNFEELFGTPHGLDFEITARLYGAKWKRVQNWEDFRASIRLASESKGLNIIEVPTDRVRNVTQHREIWQAVENKLGAIC